ncbi:hypothetical protein V501_03296 [Pseudogymnoascus sp. VKM F-4519 (FW-2642)]|nr:hypothetical protein V501_03296 [Pseudogymnoascus sp. VKM F-4519 (FW-2642)]
MSSMRILLTGANGYIGGAVLDSLLTDDFITVNKSNVSALTRASGAASVKAKGLEPIIFNSLDDTDVLAELASQHDVVIHCASGFHTLSARALILGLAQRKKQTGNEVYYIHTSGTSNIADRPISKTFSELNYPLSDKDDMFSYLKSRDSAVPYAQRTSDVVVTEVGVEYGVKTYILMSPSLYGISTDPLHEFCHTPILIRKSILLGNTPVVGDGAGSWDNLHVLDMARAYKLVLSKILSGAGADIPHGKDGVYFLQDGHHTWLELAQMVAKAGVEAGALRTTELKQLSLEEATRILTGGKNLLAEIGWASNARTSGDKIRALGWAPLRSADFETHAALDWVNILADIKAKEAAASSTR